MKVVNLEFFFKSKWFIYGSRVFILYFFSIVFKSFDLTFPNNSGPFMLRSQAFSLMYVIFGLATWEVASWLTKMLDYRINGSSSLHRLFILCVCLILYGLLISCLFSFMYSAFDIVLFHKYDAWKSFTGLSYDLYFGTFIFYMLILAYNGIGYYYNGWKEAQLKGERLMRENIQAQYAMLKNQIDPHFFFNSLSVLTNLVYKSADLSAEYITQLAKSYRYILDTKFENLVTIKTELEFLESYSFLIKIRHQDNIDFRLDISQQAVSIGLIAPATLQMLVENAVKHNRFSTSNPLRISIIEESGMLFIKNNLRKKKNQNNSFGLGLNNIIKRYELAGGYQVQVYETAHEYVVKVPIIYNHEDHNF